MTGSRRCLAFAIFGWADRTVEGAGVDKVPAEPPTPVGPVIDHGTARADRVIE